MLPYKVYGGILKFLWEALKIGFVTYSILFGFLLIILIMFTMPILYVESGVMYGRVVDILPYFLPAVVYLFFISFKEIAQ